MTLQGFSLLAWGTRRPLKRVPAEGWTWVTPELRPAGSGLGQCSPRQIHSNRLCQLLWSPQAPTPQSPFPPGYQLCPKDGLTFKSILNTTSSPQEPS